MQEFKEFTAKTVEEAIETGLKEMGLTRETAIIRVLEEGKKKLFGTVKARVEIAPIGAEFSEGENAEGTTKIFFGGRIGRIQSKNDDGNHDRNVCHFLVYVFRGVFHLYGNEQHYFHADHADYQ